MSGHGAPPAKKPRVEDDKYAAAYAGEIKRLLMTAENLTAEQLVYKALVGGC